MIKELTNKCSKRSVVYNRLGIEMQSSRILAKVGNFCFVVGFLVKVLAQHFYYICGAPVEMAAPVLSLGLCALCTGTPLVLNSAINYLKCTAP